MATVLDYYLNPNTSSGPRKYEAEIDITELKNDIVSQATLNGGDFTLYLEITSDARFDAIVQIASKENPVVTEFGPTLTVFTNASPEPSMMPSLLPSLVPSGGPSRGPSSMPSSTPTTAPSVAPSSGPSVSPTGGPSSYPSADPSGLPSEEPSGKPSRTPTGSPTRTPSLSPSLAPVLAIADTYVQGGVYSTQNEGQDPYIIVHNSDPSVSPNNVRQGLVKLTLPVISDIKRLLLKLCLYDPLGMEPGRMLSLRVLSNPVEWDEDVITLSSFDASTPSYIATVLDYYLNPDTFSGKMKIRMNLLPSDYLLSQN